MKVSSLTFIFQNMLVFLSKKVSLDPTTCDIKVKVSNPWNNLFVCGSKDKYIYFHFKPPFFISIFKHLAVKIKDTFG